MLDHAPVLLIGLWVCTSVTWGGLADVALQTKRFQYNIRRRTCKDSGQVWMFLLLAKQWSGVLLLVHPAHTLHPSYSYQQSKGYSAIRPKYYTKSGADPGSKGPPPWLPKSWEKWCTQLICWNLFLTLLLLLCTMYDTVCANSLYLLFKRYNDKCRLTLLCLKCTWRTVYWILKKWTLTDSE